jgi:hypothetical protein
MRENSGQLTKWSPEMRALICLVEKMTKKSSGWWMWTVKSPGTSSKEEQSKSATASTETAGRVPVMVASMARSSTRSDSSISTERDRMTRAGAVPA